jgi:hypothetical protein
MTVTLDLNPEIEEGLLIKARERGISLGEYLQEDRGPACAGRRPSCEIIAPAAHRRSDRGALCRV